MDAVRGVVVIGDLLRPDARGGIGGTDRPTAWLFNAVRRQIALAAALPVGLLAPTRCPALADWLGARRPAQRADEWWAAMHADLTPAGPLPDALTEALRGQFCVTYEAPPYLGRLLDRLGVPWLDVRLHPVRFLDDLIFAVRASWPVTQAALLEHALPESLVVATAGLREAMGQFTSEATVPDDTLLVVGQRPMDSTQIVGGRFFDAASHGAEIDRICAAYRAVLLKPHPTGEHHSLLVAAAAGANVLGATTDNVYRLLALPQVTAVLTVNSSAAVEAGYFGKRVHTLAPLPIGLAWRGAVADPGAHVSLDDFVLCPDFWRTVLAPHAAVSAPDGMRLPAKPNRLRIALDSFWNFNEVDTDRIPRGNAQSVSAA